MFQYKKSCHFVQKVCKSGIAHRMPKTSCTHAHRTHSSKNLSARTSNVRKCDNTHMCAATQHLENMYIMEENLLILDFLLWSSFNFSWFQATTEKNSFTKQVKKGLSNIVNLSRGTVSSSSSEVNAKKIKLAAAVASTTKAQVLQSSLSASLKKKHLNHFTVAVLK